MGDSTYACSVEGNTRSSCDGSTMGCVTETVGTASFSVSLASALYCSWCCTSANVPTMTSTTTMPIKIKNSRLFSAGFACPASVFPSVVILGSACPEIVHASCRYCFPGRSAQSSAFPAPVNDRKDARNEEQSREGSEQQSADHRAAERRILLATFSHANGHGHHADNHGQGGHDDRAHAYKAGLQRGFPGVFAFIHLFARKRNHQNAVGGGDAHAHDRAG